MSEQIKRATAALCQLIHENPDCRIDGENPHWFFGTNHVTFGTWQEKPVVYKHFDWLPRKTQEERALYLFAPTGLVPKLYPIRSESILVMERLMGSTLHQLEPNVPGDVLEKIYHHLGQTVSDIVTRAPGREEGGSHGMLAGPGFDYAFFCQASFETLFETVVERSADILKTQDVPENTLLKVSLTRLQQCRDAILAFPSFLQMDDFHKNNIMVNGSEVTGFIDLEMSRFGNEVSVLAAALAAFGEFTEPWNWFLRGYEDRRASPIDREIYDLMCVAAPFTQWIRFMWYWTTEPQFLEEGEKTRGWPIRDIRAIVQRVKEI